MKRYARMLLVALVSILNTSLAQAQPIFAPALSPAKRDELARQAPIAPCGGTLNLSEVGLRGLGLTPQDIPLHMASFHWHADLIGFVPLSDGGYLLLHLQHDARGGPPTVDFFRVDQNQRVIAHNHNVGHDDIVVLDLSRENTEEMNAHLREITDALTNGPTTCAPPLEPAH